MMAILNLSLAWSVAVPVEILGAHLQAYVLLQPTINTIRLCNRFGKGPKAAITKLPIEIVAEIEAYVTEHEREEQRQNWKKDFACFQGLCKPIDHMSDTEQVGMWQDFFADCEQCGGCSCSSGEQVKELNERQLRVLEDELDSIMADEGPEASPWWMEHDNRCERWQGKTGNKFQNAENHGLLTTYSRHLKRDFGLQVWATHTQKKEQKQDTQFAATGFFESTIACLTLPCSKTRQTLERGYSESLVQAADSPYLATQNGDGVEVAMPSELSTADHFRFSRAIKMLGLTPEDMTNPKPALWASFADQMSQLQQNRESKAIVNFIRGVKAKEGEAEEQPKKKASKEWIPKLRVLYSQAVDNEF